MHHVRVHDQGLVTTQLTAVESNGFLRPGGRHRTAETIDMLVYRKN